MYVEGMLQAGTDPDIQDVKVYWYLSLIVASLMTFAYIGVIVGKTTRGCERLLGHASDCESGKCGMTAN